MSAGGAPGSNGGTASYGGANRTPNPRLVFFRGGAAPPPPRGRGGGAPICRPLKVAPPSSSAARQRPPSARRQRDEALKLELQQAHAEHFGVYGARKLWRQLQRQGTLVARCTVERLMRELGLAG